MSYTMKALIVAAVVIAVVCITPTFAANGTVSGVITSDEAGSPVIAGASIRTDGEPGYSTVSGSDGSYSISAPEGSPILLISASGHRPQRFPVSIAGGSVLTRNISLGIAQSGALGLPAPLEWGEPSSASAPGDGFPAAFADMAATPDAGAPRIAGWNDTVKPDESFTLTGTGFTTRAGADAGTDTIVWVWARTSPSGGTLRQAKTWKITEDTIVATLPADIPFGMYFVWVENSIGASAPVCINRTTATWVGPLGNTAQAGSRKRVFGRNISYNHGTSVSYVFIQASLGGSPISCPTNSANPYMVEFTVPVDTPSGNYKVFVHNGHGGNYGWSDGLDLVVQPGWLRGASQVNISPSGGDDTTAIQNAINQMSALADGGTVSLSAGNFKIYDQIWIKSKVRFAGAGMDTTTIELRQNATRNYYARVHGSNINIENLTLRGCTDTPATPYYGIIGSANPEYPAAEADNIKYLNVRFTADYGTVLNGNNFGYTRVEFDGCEFYRSVLPAYSDGWLHNSTLYGGPYGIYYPVYRFETESACVIGDRTVYENCHIETKDWPINPANGSRNYADWVTDWDNQIGYKVWAKRVALGARFGVKHTYSANLATKDVAVQDNKGEMFLWHGGGGQWFGNVLSMDGLVMNVRTDGTLNGQPMVIGFVDESNPGLASGQPVPDANPYWVPLNSSSAVIIAGKGLGQLRQVLSHTTTSVTIDKPWRIQPDATSVILISPTYEDNVMYNNDLNAFPVGYVQGQSASIGVDFDGNSSLNFVEGNISHRTNAARNIIANASGPSYWNVVRDDKAYDCHSAGYGIFYWTYHEQNPLGPVSLGNACRSCQAYVIGSTDAGGARGWGEANIFENTIVSSKMGYYLSSAVKSSFWADGFVLYRNGSVTVIDGPTDPAAPEPVYITDTDGRQYLSGNSYAGGAQNYYLPTGLSAYSILAPLCRVARFSGYANYPVASVVVPIANAGIVPMTWTASPSDPWITATIPSNSTLAADTELGRLVVSVDTTGMSVGRHWGYVTVSSGSQSVKIGVRADIAAGVPSNQRPHASFTASPAAGPAPLGVAFNAGASYDPDGAVASYRWDFGDGTLATGVTAACTYAHPGTYTLAMTVTDAGGESDTAWSNVVVSPVLSSVGLTGSPIPPISSGTPVVLTATAVGGYQLQYKFQVNSGSGWTTVRDYQSGNTFTWTAATDGYYEVRALVRNGGSPNSYDMMSNTLSYPIGLLPTGAKLWLKSDAGISKDSGGLVSSWSDQSASGNNVNQTAGSLKPTWVSGAVNGRPVVRFTGPTQMLQSASQVLNANTAFTAFTVARTSRTAAPSYQYFWWNGADLISGGYGCCLNNGGVIQSAWGSNSGAVTGSGAAEVGTLYRICSRFNGTNGTGPHYMWINGNPVTSKGKSGSNLSGGAFTLGNFGPSPGSGLYGDIAEVLIYERALTDTEKTGVENYLTSRWVAAAPVSIDRLKDVKSLGDGVFVSITSPKVVTAASGTYSDGGIYVSETDRTCGLKVLNAGAAGLWSNLTITGTTDTDAATGEKVLTASTVVVGANTPFDRLGMSNKAFKASGQLVTVWGTVTATTGSTLTLDDGSGAPVKVQIDGLTTGLSAIPNVGDYISASGPAGYMAGAVPAVRVRSDTDIQVY